MTPGAATSSTGLAFLLATIGQYGDGWSAYWSDLIGNGAKVTKGWEDAYNVDFTQGAGGHGNRPIVVSYDSSPAFTVKGGKSTTSALLGTCFQQIEYAGLIDGRLEPRGWSGPDRLPGRAPGAGGAPREHVRVPGGRRHLAAG